MKKLASIISGTFLLVGVAGVAKAGDTIELTAAQMDDVTAGYLSVRASSYAGGDYGGHGLYVVGGSETASRSSARFGYFGPSVSSSAYNSTASHAIFGSTYGSSHAGSHISVRAGGH